MDARDYSCFYEVAKYRNFTEAAKRLYVSQPALSRQIAKLEQELGLTLFTRTKQNVALTPGGLILFNKYKEIMNAYQEMLAEARRANEGKTGELRIGLQEGQSADEHILSLIRAFQAEYENIVLDVQCLCYQEMLDQVHLGKLDVAFSLLFDEREFEGLHYRKINEMKSYAVTSADHPLALMEKPDMRILANDALIVADHSIVPYGADFVLSQCQACGFAPREVKPAPSYSTILLWLSLGLGFAVMTENAWAGNRRMCFTPLDGSRPVTRVAYGKKNNKNPAASLFMEEFLSGRALPPHP